MLLSAYKDYNNIDSKVLVICTNRLYLISLNLGSGIATFTSRLCLHSKLWIPRQLIIEQLFKTHLLTETVLIAKYPTEDKNINVEQVHFEGFFITFPYNSVSIN